MHWWFICEEINSEINPSLAEHDMPCLSKQCRSRSVLHLHCLSLNMWISIKNPDQVIWWLVIWNGCGILIYSARQGFITQLSIVYPCECMYGQQGLGCVDLSTMIRAFTLLLQSHWYCWIYLNNNKGSFANTEQINCWCWPFSQHFLSLKQIKLNIGGWHFNSCPVEPRYALPLQTV